MLSILVNKLPCMTLRKERIWQIQPWNTWEKQVQSGAKEVFPPPWWILDSNGISPMLGHLYNTSWLQVCTLWTVNDVSGKDLFTVGDSDTGIGMSTISAFLKNCQNSTFLPMHENLKFFGPNDFIWSGKVVNYKIYF